MASIVIFGSSGFLGSNLLHYFSATQTAFGIHGMSRGLLSVHSSKVSKGTDLDFNFSNMAKLMEILNPSIVINSSGLIGDFLCEKSPELARKANIETPRQLAVLSRERGFYLIHYSTDAVFNDSQKERNEEVEPKPITFYGRSKLEGEIAGLESSNNMLVVRTNFVGINHKIRGNEGLFNYFATRLSQGLHVRGYTDVFFNPIVMNPLLSITKQIIERRLKGTLNIAGLNQLSKYEFATLVAKYLGVKSNLVERLDESSDQITHMRKLMILDIGKMLALGLHPGVLEEGTRELCENFRSSQGVI